MSASTALTRKNSQSNRALKYFEQITIGNNIKFQCIDKDCAKVIDGKKISNLVSHYRVCHKQIYHEIIAIKKDENYYGRKRLQFIQNCAEMVAINGRPFLSLTDSGFRKFIDADLKELQEAGWGISFDDTSYTEIKAYITKLALKVENKIKIETNAQFLSIMVDIARKNNRSFLGISAQYMICGVVKVRALGMKQLKSAHTAKYIKDVITNCLTLFDIKIDQVVSMTTDNGSNMLAMIDLFNVDGDVGRGFDNDSGADDDGGRDVRLVDNNTNNSNIEEIVSFFSIKGYSFLSHQNLYEIFSDFSGISRIFGRRSDRIGCNFRR